MSPWTSSSNMMGLLHMSVARNYHEGRQACESGRLYAFEGLGSSFGDTWPRADIQVLLVVVTSESRHLFQGPQAAAAAARTDENKTCDVLVRSSPNRSW